MTIYLVQKAHTDSMENSFDRAFYYETVGYVNNQYDFDSALLEQIVEDSECWAVRYERKPVHRYKLVEIKEWGI